MPPSPIPRRSPLGGGVHLAKFLNDRALGVAGGGEGVGHKVFFDTGVDCPVTVSTMWGTCRLFSCRHNGKMRCLDPPGKLLGVTNTDPRKHPMLRPAFQRITVKAECTTGQVPKAANPLLEVHCTYLLDCLGLDTASVRGLSHARESRMTLERTHQGLC